MSQDFFKDEELIKISSINQFITEINHLQEVDLNSNDKVEFFYRGESQLYKNTKPSILREQKYFEKEKEITIEAFSRGFTTLSTEGTNFDKISKFQHHSGLTRMLDITSNALTALFFSCSSNMDKDGSVLIFRGSQEDNIIHDETLKELKEALREKEFSIISKTDKNYSEKLIKIIEEKEKQSNIKFFLSDTAESLSTLSLLSLKSKMELSLYSMTDYITLKKSPKLLKKSTRASYQKFYGEIKRRTPAFEKRIEVLDLFRPIIVIPSQNDERILRQDGAFIVTGLSYSKEYNKNIIEYCKYILNKTDEETDKEKEKEPSKPVKKLKDSDVLKFYKIHENFVIESLKEMRVKKDNKPIRFIIEENKKIEILKQLEKLGVNTGKIYVNLDNISNHLRDKYK